MEPTILSATAEAKVSTQNGRMRGPDHEIRSGATVPEFPQHSLLDYLQVDPRPTLVLDIAAPGASDKVFEARHVFRNPALASSRFLLQRLVANNEKDAEHRRFTWWLKASASPEGERLPHYQYEHLWTAVLLDSRWMIVSGVKHEQEQTALPNLLPHQESLTINQFESPHPGDHHLSIPRNSRKRQNFSAESLNRLPFAQLPPSDHVTFIQNFDWAATTLGPIETWSSPLRQACEMMLSNPDPCTIFWGDDLTMVWNEPYVAIAGNKHPKLFGQSARLSWGEVWDQYDHLFTQMRVDRKPFKQENAQLLINRNGYLEEGYFNLRVMPVQSEDGVVVGFYEPVVEMTRQVLAGRRLATLLKISETLPLSTSIEDLWQMLLKALHGHESDVLFAALYVTNSDTGKSGGHDIYTLKGGVGLDCARLPTPRGTNASGNNDSNLYPAFQRARQTKAPVVLREADGSLSQPLLENLRECGLKVDCRSIVVSPLKSGTDASVTAMLVIGTNPKREYDDDYNLFVHLLVRQIEGTLTFIELFAKERELLKEQAAYQSELKIQTFAERAQVGIFIFEPDGAIKFCNDAWLEMCGLSRDEIHVPMCWVDTVHPEIAPEIVQYWEKISNLEGPQTFEVQYRKPWLPKSGNPNMSLDRTYVLASAYAEVSESGELTGILGCVTDISHVKWAEKIQSQRLEEALELKRQQENFLDITSHEMRNPLNAILHCAGELVDQLTILKEDRPSTKTKATILHESLDAASTIAYCGKHQKRIIDDVLTMSKLDSNLLVVAPLPSQPPQIVQQVLSVFETEIRASMIDTEMEISKSYRELAVDTVLIDSHRVIQIIINLFSNAIKFLKAENHRNLKIVIGATKEEPTDREGGVRYVPSGRHRKDPTTEPEWGTGESLFLTFSVQDTGPGMTPDEANSLFHRFIQGSPRTHAQYGGSGLGLFISRELTELHGGKIGLSSQVGLGSTFDFYIKGRRDVTQKSSAATLAETSVASKSSKSRPQMLGARLRDLTSSKGPSFREVRSSPSVMQVKGNDRVRILVVEDNLINQQILTKLLHKQGYEVSIANHGEEALALIESSRWHVKSAPGALEMNVVLCDVEMPVMDGKTMVRRVREMQKQKILFSHIPVIAVTGYARPEQIKAALECGFDDVVSKPYEVDDLIERIGKFTK